MQNYNNLSNDKVKDLLEIKDDSIHILDLEIYSDQVYVHVMKDRINHTCPVCGQTTNKIKDYHTRKIKHSRFHQKDIHILYKQRRYLCSCGKCFNESNTFVEKHNKISSYTKKSLMKDLTESVTFKHIGRVHNISDCTVRRVFMKHLIQPRKKLPTVLSIDEFKGNASGHKYHLQISDPINKQIIDILPTRRQDDIIEYFKSIPLQELNNVSLITMDMSSPFYHAMRKLFPSATVVIDRFHITRTVTVAFNNVRIRVMKEFKQHSKEYKLLKNNWGLLLKNSADIKENLRYSKRKKRITSSSHTIDDCIRLHSTLKVAYDYLQEFYTILHHTDYEDSTIVLKDWIQNANYTNIKELTQAAQTIENWLPEICNSFMFIPGTNRHYSNAFVEGTNNFIKVLKRNAYGFRNFVSFRSRIIYQHNHSHKVISA